MLHHSLQTIEPSAQNQGASEQTLRQHRNSFWSASVLIAVSLLMRLAFTTRKRARIHLQIVEWMEVWVYIVGPVGPARMARTNACGERSSNALRCGRMV